MCSHSTSSLLQRRGQAALAVRIPAASTGLRRGDDNSVQLVGIVGAVAVQQKQQRQQRQAQPPQAVAGKTLAVAGGTKAAAEAAAAPPLPLPATSWADSQWLVCSPASSSSNTLLPTMSSCGSLGSPLRQLAGQPSPAMHVAIDCPVPVPQLPPPVPHFSAQFVSASVRQQLLAAKWHWQQRPWGAQLQGIVVVPMASQSTD